MSSTEDFGDFFDRAREGMSAATSWGIIPTRTARDADGSLIPPAYAYWIPWLAVLLITVISGVVGFANPRMEPGVVVAVVTAATGGAAAATPFLVHSLERVGVVEFVLVFVTVMVLSTPPYVMGMAVVIWFLPARMYHRAEFDAQAIERAADVAASSSSGGNLFMIVEVIDRACADGAKVRLDPVGGGMVHPRNVRDLPSDCAEGALLVLDDGGACMASISAEMYERFRHLEETVR